MALNYHSNADDYQIPSLAFLCQSKFISQLSIKHFLFGCLLGISNLTCPKRTLVSCPTSHSCPSLYCFSINSSILPEPHRQNLEDIFDYSLFLHTPSFSSLNPSANPSKYIHNHHFQCPHPHPGLHHLLSSQNHTARVILLKHKCTPLPKILQCFSLLLSLKIIRLYIIWLLTASLTPLMYSFPTFYTTMTSFFLIPKHIKYTSKF